MKNFKTLYERIDEEFCEELTERETKEKRIRKFREKREIGYPVSLDRYSSRFISKRL